MTAPISEHKVFYCSRMPDLSVNHPEEVAQDLHQLHLTLISLGEPRDSPIVQILLKLKAEWDDLAHTVKMALDPQKRRKAIKAFQMLTKNTPQAKALALKINPCKLKK